jgi:hypothetical protein
MQSGWTSERHLIILHRFAAFAMKNRSEQKFLEMTTLKNILAIN